MIKSRTRLEVANAIAYLRVGRIGLMKSLTAEGLNIGLRKMAATTTIHRFWNLLSITVSADGRRPCCGTEIGKLAAFEEA